MDIKKKKAKNLVIETIYEILIAIKKMGIPFVILGSLFLIYSKLEGEAVIPFNKFMMVFLSMILFQIILENVWLEKEIYKLREELKDLRKEKLENN